MSDLNPQAKQMADESMVRNLSAQAQAIWPQEAPLFSRYALQPQPRILDAGCGTGEIASRLVELFPTSHVLGVDIIDKHLSLAQERYRGVATRLEFEHRSIFDLGIADQGFDLTVCRHVLHSIPQVGRAIAELVRVTRRGGYLHFIPEDYGMLHFERGENDPRDFWHPATAAYGAANEVDLFIGRHIFRILCTMDIEEIKIDYVVVDTLRVPRDTFAAIIEAWRDGYTESIAELTPFSRELTRTYFDQMIENIRDPRGYAVWMVPVVSARVMTAANSR